MGIPELFSGPCWSLQKGCKFIIDWGILLILNWHRLQHFNSSPWQSMILDIIYKRTASSHINMQNILYICVVVIFCKTIVLKWTDYIYYFINFPIHMELIFAIHWLLSTYMQEFSLNFQQISWSWPNDGCVAYLGGTADPQGDAPVLEVPRDIGLWTTTNIALKVNKVNLCRSCDPLV